MSNRARFANPIFSTLGIFSASLTLAGFSGGIVKLANWCEVLLENWTSALISITSFILPFAKFDDGFSVFVIWMTIFLFPFVLFCSRKNNEKSALSNRDKLKIFFSFFLLVIAVGAVLRFQIRETFAAQGVDEVRIGLGFWLPLTLMQLYGGWFLGNFFRKKLKLTLSLTQLADKLLLMVFVCVSIVAAGRFSLFIKQYPAVFEVLN